MNLDWASKLLQEVSEDSSIPWDNPQAVGVIVIFVVLSVGAVFLVLGMDRAQKRRLAGIAAWARSQGLTAKMNGLSKKRPSFFAPEDTTELGHFFADYETFQPMSFTSARSVNVCLTGELDSVDWSIFEYTDSGKDATVYTVFCGRYKTVFPRIEILPESMFDRLGKALGASDVDFESEDFNRRYLVKTKDEAFAHQLIDPNMIDFLLACPGHHWQLSGNQIVVSEYGSLNPSGYGITFDHMKAFISVIPAIVRKDFSLQN